MTNATVTRQIVLPSKLKDTFDAALVVLHKDKEETAEQVEARKPIVRRPHAVSPVTEAENLRKRALADAADALAALWKIPDSGSSRANHHSR